MINERLECNPESLLSQNKPVLSWMSFKAQPCLIQSPTRMTTPSTLLEWHHLSKEAMKEETSGNSRDFVWRAYSNIRYSWWRAFVLGGYSSLGAPRWRRGWLAPAASACCGLSFFFFFGVAASRLRHNNGTTIIGTTVHSFSLSLCQSRKNEPSDFHLNICFPTQSRWLPSLGS